MEITPQIQRAKASAEKDLLKLANVTGVGVGEKITKGQRVGKACVRVYVKKKLPKDRVGKGQLIPASVGGVPTDVIEREFVLHPASVALSDLELMADAGTYDPLTGGISIGPCRAVGGSVFVGTLGLVVEDNNTGDPMMLSNFHVMCIDNNWSVGDTMAQPARAFDGGSCPSDVVGELTRAQLGGQVDCAVARITNRGHNCRITEIGNVSGTATAVDGEAVRKRGRTTELTHGFVDDISLTVTIDYDFGIGNVTLTNQIGIEVDASQSTQFGNNGDSGSVVVNSSGEVIGLYFAGTSTGDYGVANPISAVLSALDVKLCQPTIAPTSVWADVPTSPWADQWGTIWETLPWADFGGGGTANKNFDDVKNPAGYDTLMETIFEGGGFTLQEGGGFTLQEGGGTLQEGGGFDPGDPRFPNPPGRFGGGGAAPFALSTPHHAAGAQRFEGQGGAGGPDIDQEIEQVRQYLKMLEARKRGQ
jgi:S1-C subfamily serine protease